MCGTDQELIINGGIVNVPLMVIGNHQSQQYGSNSEIATGVNCKIIINDGEINIAHGTETNGTETNGYTYEYQRGVGIGFSQAIGGELIINGGIINIDSYSVNSSGSYYSLYPIIGIGFYNTCENGIITVNGGTINAKGTIGIGFGGYSDDGRLIINQGNITATGCDMGIGFTQDCKNGELTINGGHVVASSKWDSGVGIGVGDRQKNNTNYSYSNNFDINLNGGIISAYPDISFAGNCGIGLSKNGSGTVNINISSDIIRLESQKGSSGECIGKATGSSGTTVVKFYDDDEELSEEDKNSIFSDVEKDNIRTIRGKSHNRTITVADNIKTKVRASMDYAIEGETITLKLSSSVNPSSLRVAYGEETAELTAIGGYEYTFVMPDSNVVITSNVNAKYSISIPDEFKIVSATNDPDSNGKYPVGTVIGLKAKYPYTAVVVSDGSSLISADDEGIFYTQIIDRDIEVTADLERSDDISLDKIEDTYIAANGDTLSSETDVTVVLPSGTEITLSGATINGGIICEGDASILLENDNSVTGLNEKAGIQIGPEGSTLHISGDGSLNATGGSQSAGIGLSKAWGIDVFGGSIVINSGNVTAKGGQYGAGIGTGVCYGKDETKTASIEGISIMGGIVTAIGGSNAAGIGKGYGYSKGTTAVNAISVFDGIDNIVTSSVSNGVVYMHENTDVTENKEDYFEFLQE